MSTINCRYCGRSIIEKRGEWINPDATGDDSIWRASCEANDTFTAEHEPEPEYLAKVERLKALDAEAAALRKELGFSEPNKEISRWDTYDRDAITVIADGYGKATVIEIEQLGWDDYLENKTHQEISEQRACRLAELLAERAGVDIGE